MWEEGDGGGLRERQEEVRESEGAGERTGEREGTGGRIQEGGKLR